MGTLWHGRRLMIERYGFLRMVLCMSTPQSLRNRSCLGLQTCKLIQTFYSTEADSASNREMYTPKKSFIEPILKFFGYSGFTSVPKSKLAASAARLYVCCTEYSDFDLFVKQFKMEDSFASWSNLVQLHMWILMMRLKNHNLPLQKDFSFLVTQTNKSMWTDLNNRAKKLAHGSIKRDSLVIIGEHYKASVLGYDEGYFTDDKTLASAVWRNLLVMNTKIEPNDLLILVDYIHKNLNHLSTIPDTELLDGIVTFIPLHSDKTNKDKDKLVYKRISVI